MILGRLGGVAEMNNGEGGVKVYAGLLEGNARFENGGIGRTDN